jgi:hypothetical protein
MNQWQVIEFFTCQLRVYDTYEWNRRQRMRQTVVVVDVIKSLIDRITSF